MPPHTVRSAIIIIKKKARPRGHHGGAWKVAYADFVTAMMALFIVLWLMNASEHVQKAIAGYFEIPKESANKPESTGRQRERVWSSPRAT